MPYNVLTLVTSSYVIETPAVIAATPEQASAQTCQAIISSLPSDGTLNYSVQPLRAEPSSTQQQSSYQPFVSAQLVDDDDDYDDSCDDDDYDDFPVYTSMSSLLQQNREPTRSATSTNNYTRFSN